MKLFISYNSKNRHFAEALARNLTQNGFEVFYDVESIQAGDIWAKVIQEGMNNSDAALICIGEEGIGGWQIKEVLNLVNNRTETNGYRLIPVVLPANNGFVNYPLPWFLADYQWVEFKDATDNYALSKLLEGLRVQQEVETIQIGQNPYKGLKSFDVKDANCFFGRTYSLNLVFHNKLRFQVSILDHNFLAIVADSGVGKSSFVKAGILAALQNGKFAGSNNWKQIIFKPGQSPMSALSSTLKINELIIDSRKFEENAGAYTDELLRTIRDQTQTWVIYIDQFEETITQCKDETERTTFLNNIARAVETDKAIVLLSVRSDFYTAFAPYTLFKSVLEQNNFTLSGIDLGNKEDNILREIIVQPAKNAGVKLDDSLVNSIINDLKQVKGKLPILQLTLDLLWKRKNLQTNKITLEDYAAIAKNKNIAGIIEAHADTVFNNITNNGKDTQKAELFKKIFVPHLVEVSNNGEDVRKTALKSDLLAINGFTKEEIEKMLQELSSEDARLLTMQETDKQIKVEVVHEVIIREWPMLKGWIDERREALIYRDRIIEDIKNYKNGRGYIYKNKMLHFAREWQENNPDLVNYEIGGFIKESKMKAKKSLELFLIVFFILTILAAVFYKPFERWIFIKNIRSVPSLEEQYEAAGGNIDSIKSLTIDASNYLNINNKLSYFKNLDSLTIRNLPIFNLSIFDFHIQITTLSIEQNDNITSLDGIQQLSSLKSLSIYNNENLTSLHGIENFKSLKSLAIDHNIKLNNFEEIEKIDSLKLLALDQDKISLQEIEKFRTLTELRINNDLHLAKLKGIDKLKLLTSLTINSDSLNSLEAIMDLKFLTSLEMYGNNTITNWKSIQQLKSLSILSGPINSLPCLNEVKKLDSLICLYAPLNTMTNLNGVEKFRSLTKLSLQSGSLTSLNGIENFGSITSLEVAFSNILSDLQGIEKLSSLKSLYILDNFKLDSLKGIDKLSSLTSLTIYENKKLNNILDVEKLGSLITLTITKNSNLVNLPDFGKLRSLTSLTICENEKLTNLQRIERLDSLTSLKIFNNMNLKSFPAIEKLGKLDTLTIGNHEASLYINKLYDLRHLKVLIVPKDLNIEYERLNKNNPGIKLIRKNYSDFPFF